MKKFEQLGPVSVFRKGMPKRPRKHKTRPLTARQLKRHSNGAWNFSLRTDTQELEVLSLYHL